VLNEKSICQKPKINVYCQIARLFFSFLPKLPKSFDSHPFFPQEFSFFLWLLTIFFSFHYNIFWDLKKVKVLYRATFLPFFSAMFCRKMISLYLLLRIEPLLIVVEFLDLIQTVSINFYKTQGKKIPIFPPTKIKHFTFFSFEKSKAHETFFSSLILLFSFNF
jgi:hypothetical protein